MGKVIIYGINLSPPVRAVLLTAHAINLDYEFRVINTFAGENKTEEYLQKNPQHTVPTLEDDGKFIWDSHAIALYLVEKYGNDKFLYPKDLYKRAIIEQRLHFDSGVLFPGMRQLISGARATGKMADEDIKKIEEAYGFMDKFLENDLYLGGNCVTVADLCCVATVSTLNIAIPVDGSKFEKLAKWLQRMSLLPYYEKANGEALVQCREMLKTMMTKVE